MLAPRAMPEAGVMQHSFEPQRVDYMSPEIGARLGAVSVGWPLWYLGVDLNNMSEDDADVWRAWVDGQRGPQRLFYGCDFSRLIPKFHAEGIPFTATPASWSQAIDEDGVARVTLTGLLPGMVLSYCDLIGFEWGGWKRSLVRAMEEVSAGADGHLTVIVEPPVHPITPPSATVNLNRPTCLMRLVPGATKLGVQMYGGRWTNAGGRLEAVQDLIP